MCMKYMNMRIRVLSFYLISNNPAVSLLSQLKSSYPFPPLIQNHSEENVNFICEVLKYQSEAEVSIMKSSRLAGEEMKEQAMTMYYQYLQINSPDEVNVSSTTRDVLERQLNLWSPQSQIISRSKTKNELEIGNILCIWN
jgi:hypothetical protein